MKIFQIDFVFSSGRELYLNFTADNIEEAANKVNNCLGTTWVTQNDRAFCIPDLKKIEYFTIKAITKEEMESSEK